jgi:hypothetical protein
MRRNILALLSALMLAPAGVAAQGIGLGLVGGANFANLDSDQIEETNNITRIMGGAYLSLWFSPTLALETEALFSQKGAAAPAGPGVTFDLDISYLEIPVLARVKFPAGAVGVSLFAGPTFGFKMDCKASFNSGGAEVSDDCDETEISLKSSDMGATAGASLDLGGFSIFGRYVYGLSDISENENGETKNRVLTLGVRLRLLGR